jgi:hypothetical protein
MADDIGKMLFALTASKDQTNGVGGDSKREVGVNENHDVVSGYEAHIDGKFLATILASTSQATKAGQKMQTDTGMIVNIGAIDYLATGGSRKLTVLAAYGEAIGGLHLIQCNQDNLQVSGVMKRDVAGDVKKVSAMANGETVTGWRRLTVGGSCTIRAVLGAAEASKVSAEYKTGSAKDAALGGISHKAPKTQFLASGNIDYSVDERVLLMAKKVFIKASFVDVVGGKKLEIGRGTIKIDGGKVKIKATVKRKQASKAGS